MKKSLYIIISFLFYGSTVYSQIPTVKLFDDTVIHEIKITSTDPNFWANLDSDYNNASNGGGQSLHTSIPYRQATVEIDGVVMLDVGVRQKGFSSNFFVDAIPSNKKPLKLNFGKFVADREYDDVRKLNLTNGFGDPSIIKDKLVYDMFRFHGIPAPRVAHAKVYVQGVFWGIYAMIEQVDKRFLKRNYASNDGNLWKNRGNTSFSGVGPPFPLETIFELQTNETANDFTKLNDFVQFINNINGSSFEAGIESHFDVDEYLRILAIDVATNNWDSYLEHGRNWYLYHNPKTNKIHWIPWDYNFSFDREVNGSNDLHILNATNAKILIDKILGVPRFKTKYLDYMCELLQFNMINSRLDPLMDSHLALIQGNWTSSNQIYSEAEALGHINAPTWTEGQGMKAYIGGRTASLRSALSTENHNCATLPGSIAIGDVVINEFMPANSDTSIWSDQDGDHDDWVELYNNTNSPIDLTNYFLSDSRSFIHKWEFPENTVIPANSFLIVWTDKDVQQNGLHTKFNLDKNGDELYLSYLDGTIVDSVDWDNLIAEDKSWSRFPNGTGTFQEVDITFNATNSNTLGINDLSSEVLFKVFPNPAYDVVNLRFSNAGDKNITVTDMLGRTTFRQSESNQNTSINVSDWRSGIYLIHVEQDGNTDVEKVIVK
ncbi:MAG: CotH kinase family protein [Nonlabens sp.]|uniref:CotH kinase family protein n=1 Tax=Nonlabens sp. TaxID=1888209 RepID=UPI003EF97210